MRLTAALALGALGLMVLSADLTRGGGPYGYGIVLTGLLLLLALLALLSAFLGRRSPGPPRRWVLLVLAGSALVGGLVGRHGTDDHSCPSVVGGTPYAEVHGRCVPVPEPSAATSAG